MIRILCFLAAMGWIVTPVMAGPTSGDTAVSRTSGINVKVWQVRNFGINVLKSQTEAMITRRVIADKVARLRPKAEAGDVYAMLRLGNAYLRTALNGVPGSFSEATKWYKMAADTGNADAMFRLGSAYMREGAWTPDVKPADGLAWMEKAAAGGSAAAERELGQIYGWRALSRSGEPDDEAKSAEWFRRAAVHGNVEAQLMMARRSDEGGSSEYPQALSWYRKAAAQGNEEASDALDMTYAYGDQVRTYAEAYRRLQLDAEAGVADAEWRYALLDDGDLQEAGLRRKQGIRQWLLKSVAQGNTKAALILAHMQDDFGVPDHVRELADAGNIPARAEWARYKLYREDGDETALALTWLKQAADANCRRAQSILANLYERGVQLPKDRVEGLKWRILATQPNLNATGDVEDYAFDLSDADRTEGIYRAETWKATHRDLVCQ